MIQGIDSALLLQSLLLSLLSMLLTLGSLLSLGPLLPSVLWWYWKSKLLLLLWCSKLLLRHLPQRLSYHWWSWSCIPYTLLLSRRTISLLVV